MTLVADPTTGAPAFEVAPTPAGEPKQSRFGPREQGIAGLRFFSETRTIYG